MVVFTSPVFDLFLGVLKRQKPVDVKALVAKRAVKRFDKGFVGRPTGTREVEGEVMLVGPLVKDPADALASIIGLYPFGDAMTSRKLLHNGHDLLASDA